LAGPPLQFFINALTTPHRQHWAVHTILNNVSSERRKNLFAQNQILFGGAALLAAADLTVTHDGVKSGVAPMQPAPPTGAIFGFESMHVTVSENGTITSYGPRSDSRSIKRFKRLVAPSTYAKAMSERTGEMLKRLWPPPPRN
jgi:hypothetical protein